MIKCLSYRNWETLDRDVFCPDCSLKLLDQRWLRFRQKLVLRHRDPNPEDVLLDIEAYNPTGVACPCCGFAFSCRASLLQHVRKRAVYREGLEWMWQQHSNGVTSTFPICAMSGKAKSKRKRARIPHMWRELLVRRLTQQALAQAKLFRARSAERAISPARTLPPEALGPKGCFRPSWRLASEAERVAPQSGAAARHAPRRFLRRTETFLRIRL